MRKGITPIIAIIVLLLITVALAGAAWTYLSGVMGTYTEKSFVIPGGGAYCSSAGTITVNIVNTGTSTITTPTDWTTLSVDPTCTGSPAASGNIAPKSMGTITVTGCTAGSSYTVHAGTIAGTQHPVVVCP
jgi:flagellin-like protein